MGWGGRGKRGGWRGGGWGGMDGEDKVGKKGGKDVRELLGLGRSLGSPGTVLARAVTLLAVLVAWVFFRAPDMATAVDVLKGMAGLNGIGLPGWAAPKLQWLAQSGLHVRFDGIQWIDFGSVAVPLLMVATGIALFAPNTQQIVRDAAPDELRPSASSRIDWRPSPLWSAAVGITLVACVLSLNNASEFLYFQF